MKKLEQSFLVILRLLLNTKITWMIFINKIEEYNPNKKPKRLIVFEDVITDMLSNKRRNPIVD